MAFPSDDKPGFGPSPGYEAPIYDEHGCCHEPYTDEWYKTVNRCANIVLGPPQPRWKRMLSRWFNWRNLR